MIKTYLMLCVVGAANLLFGAASTHFALDNRSGARIAGATERISFSSTWESDATGATSMLSINGEYVNESTVQGVYEWTPAQGGTYEFAHAVFVNGVQIGKTLTATYIVSELKPFSADWVEGSITLKATGVDIQSGELIWLEYCDATIAENEGVEWTAVSGFTSLYEKDGISFTDPQFASRLGGVKPLKYRLRIGTSMDNIRVTLFCKTRTRYGLFVGYSSYKKILGLVSLANPAQQFLRDATEFKRLCNEKGGFDNDKTMILSNTGAKAQDIRDAFTDFANRTKPGDEFLFFIATHGGDYLGKVAAGLRAYDEIYSVDALQTDVRKFPSSVAVVGVVMACCSEAMLGGASGRHNVDAWLARQGFDQCLGNVAWIASCASSESSYFAIDSAHTLFGQALIKDGFERGRADRDLYGVEFEGGVYGGGNKDGVITFGELGRYVGALSKGISDEQSSSVQLENDGLLERIVIDESVAAGYMSRPNQPSNVSVSQGLFDLKISIGWDAVDTAASYRIYRSAGSSPGVFKWIGTSLSQSYEDSDVELSEIYTYKISAVSAAGVSEWSSAATGSRGSDKYLSYLAKLIGSDSASLTTADYRAKEKSVAANGSKTVGECYVVGVDPEDPNDDLEITDFKIVDGKPQITVNHSKDGAGNSLEPRIRTLGKSNLTDDKWEDISGKDSSSYRYFKVKVDLQ